jgi:hypothetical protein
MPGSTTKAQRLIANAYCGWVDYGYVSPFSVKLRK